MGDGGEDGAAHPRQRRRRSASVGQTIGGVLVGFDEQVWSKRPPAQELVTAVDRLGSVVVPGGMTIDLPAPPTTEPASPEPGDTGGPTGPDDPGEAVAGSPTDPPTRAR